MSYDSRMAKGLFEVECPCCQAALKIDPETRAVITHRVPEKPPPIEDLAAAVAKLKGEAGRRDEVFRKQVEAEKSRGAVLNSKFDELLRQAKENPDVTPPGAFHPPDSSVSAWPCRSVCRPVRSELRASPDAPQVNRPALPELPRTAGSSAGHPGGQ